MPILIPLSRRSSSRAKESIYWLYGEHSKISDKLSLWAPDVLRLAALEFQMEPVDVKLQILNMAVKLVSNHETTSPVIRALVDYLISLSNFDTNVDVRDRARFFNKVLNNEYLGTRLKVVVIPLNVAANKSILKLDMGTCDIRNLSLQQTLLYLHWEACLI